MQLTRFVPIICIILFVTAPIKAQVKSNFFIIDSLARAAAASACNTIGNNVKIAIVNHPAAWLIRARLAETCIRTSRDEAADGTLGITALGVNYERIANEDDSLRRICSVALAGAYAKKPNGELTAYSTSGFNYQDVIAESDIASVEAGGYDFTSAAIPPRPSSFIRDFIEPIVLAASAALTVFLLYTVRTQ